MPYEMEQEQPLIVTQDICNKSKEVRELLIESLEADYVIVTSEDRPGD